METIGGFRLVRRLGSGGRAEVHLGHSIVSLDGDPPRMAAIKVFRPTTSAASIDDEIDALARLSSPFLISLTDLAIADDGRPVLVLDRLVPTTCARLILDRQHLTAGEAVTVLAPLTDAVDELARVGVVHGGIRLDRVGFDDIGTPVLMGFGHARVIGPAPDGEVTDDRVGARAGTTAVVTQPAGAATLDPALDSDTADLAAVARSVLDSIRPTSRSADLLHWLALPVEHPVAFRTELRSRLFDLADPEPVVVEAGARRSSTVPAIGTAPHSDRDAETESDGTPDWLTAVHLPDWMLDLLPTGRRTAPGLVTHWTGAVIRFLAPVRRPVWIAAGSVAVLFVAVGVASAVGSAGEARAAPGRSEPSATPVASGKPESGGGGTVDQDESDRSSSGPEQGDPGDSAAPSESPDRISIRADDAVAAAAALLRERAECLRQESVICLDGVDQQGSAALEADAALVRSLQEGASNRDVIDFSTALPTVTEQLGGTVILSVAMQNGQVGDAAPTSLLLVRGEEGWRIRDLIVG